MEGIRMKTVIMSILLILWCLSGEARTCETKKYYGNSTDCPTYVQKFETLVSFNAWVSSHRFTEFEIFYTNGEVYVIRYWTNDCRVTDVCFDRLGICTP